MFVELGIATTTRATALGRLTQVIRGIAHFRCGGCATLLLSPFCLDHRPIPELRPLRYPPEHETYPPVTPHTGTTLGRRYGPGTPIFTSPQRHRSSGLPQRTAGAHSECRSAILSIRDTTMPRQLSLSTALFLVMALSVSAAAYMELAIEEEQSLGWNIIPAQQGIVCAHSHGYVTSKGALDPLNSPAYPLIEKKLYRFDLDWDHATEQAISYQGDSGIYHVGDIAYVDNMVFAPTSDFIPYVHDADKLHIVEFEAHTLDYQRHWDVSTLADPDFGDLAGLTWHDGLLYAVEWRRENTPGSPHLFVFQRDGNYLLLMDTFLLSSTKANGIAFWGDYLYVCAEDPARANIGYIYRYSLAELDADEVNHPHYSYSFDIKWYWNPLHPDHAEGLTFNDYAPSNTGQAELWIAASDYAVRLATPDDEFEPNDSSAQPLDYGAVPQDWVMIQPTLILADQHDWFRFSTTTAPPEGSHVRIEFEHEDGDLDLCVYRGNQTLIGCSEGVGDSEEVSLAGEAAGEFYIDVYGYGGVFNPDYSLTIDLYEVGGPPNKPTNPSPPDGAASVSVNTDVSWANGGGATSFDVYFGTDPTPDQGEYQGNQLETWFDPGALSYETDYYWRIDAVNEYDTTTGDVWHFSTESDSGEDDGYEFNRSTTCQDVMDEDPWDPIYEIDAFGHDDGYVFAWLRLDYLETSLRVKFDWYTPADQYYSGWTSGWTDDPGEYGYEYWYWWKFWSYIHIEGTEVADMEGKWRVRIYVDTGSGWTQVSTEDFTLRYELTDHTMCKDVNENDPWNPIDPTSVFYQTDEKAVAWFELSKVSNGLDVKWRYLEPNGSEYTSIPYSIDDPNNEGADYWTFFRTWSWIGINGYGAESKCGDWAVEFFIKDVWGNWDLEYVESFQIFEDPNVDPLASIEAVPAEPLEGDPITLIVDASDNTYLDRVIVSWHDGTWHEVVLGEDINASGFNDAYEIGPFELGQEILYEATAIDTSQNVTVTAMQSVVVESRWGYEGPDGGSWFNPENWAGGVIPDGTADVVIPAGSHVVIDGPGAEAKSLTIEGSASVTFIAGSDLTVTDGVWIEYGASIYGDGTIYGDVFNSGLVSPGSSIGVLTILGNYTQEETGALRIELADQLASDVLDVTDYTVDLDGRLALELIDPYGGWPGDSFDVVWFGSVVGDFATIDVPVLDECLLMTTGIYMDLVRVEFQVPSFEPEQVAKLLASDGGVNDEFGYSVSISGDRAVVGAWADDDNGEFAGSAYVFRYNGIEWVEEAKLLASDGAAGDRFGRCVSISGGVVVIGADSRDDNGTESGAAYIFRFDGTNWIQEDKLLAPDGEESDFFGVSVVVSGDIAVIGALADDDNGYNSGSAYVFRYGNADWLQEAKLLPSDGDVEEYFGGAVSISGETVVVGANYDNDNGLESGSAYVFRYDGMSWSEEAKLLPGDGESKEYFGWSVSISGDIALVGAKKDDDNGFEAGSAYVFRYDGSEWVEETKLLCSDGAEDDQFGFSVSICDDTAVVGAVKDDDGGVDSGATYVFDYDGVNWKEEAEILAGDGAPQDHFGWSVSISGAAAIIGTPDDDDAGDKAGAAYVFRVPDSSDCNDNGIADQCDLYFGYSEDVNDNGIPDECECFSDINGDGVVNVVDLLVLLGDWPCNGEPGECIGDVNWDGVTNTEDLLQLLGDWGSCPYP